MVLQRPQPRRYPIRSLVEALKPVFKPPPGPPPLFNFSGRHLICFNRRLLGFSGRLLSPCQRSLSGDSAGGWRRFGGPSRKGWWNQIGVRTRRPANLGDRIRRPGARLSRLLRSPSTLLGSLSRPTSLPSSIKRHLTDHPNPLLRSPRDHQRLVDPRLELGQGRHRALRHDPVLGGIPLRSLDTAQFRTAGGGKLARSIDLAAPDRQRTTRGAR